MTDYQGAIWIPNNNFYPDTGVKTHIVIHGTAGGNSAKEIAYFFQGTSTTDNPVSSNYIVDQAGVIVQCVDEKDGAWAQGVDNQPEFKGTFPNTWSISIEHVKSTTDNSDQLTPAQQAASLNLINDIRRRNNIPIENIIPHNRITQTACPGPFPWDAMRNYLGGTMLQNYGPGAKDFDRYFTAIDTDRWQCKKTGNIIQFDILRFFETLSRDGQSLPIIGLPTSGELYEAYEGNVTPIVLQFFERAVAVYNPSHSFDSQPGAASTFLAKYDDPFIVGIDEKRKENTNATR